ncbi:hypothetical protein CY34DRAFT_635391 [Suillus luteus UH-Slu-Lm8-n1]|uniref:Uncharacterized protein n=1 Tax=Suillus luteus UH-Slu-Lm8-n1 TaxID=930992 RepID=A0A0D0AK02_9AGAM|nr:hypothetical protein CY34DRAFT_635391 [Suillus luteus UH-Slu-Lm8-n1]
MVTFLTTNVIQSSFFSTDPTLAVCSLVRRFLLPSISDFHRMSHLLLSLVLRTPTSVVDSEAQPPDQTLDVVATNKCHLELKLPRTLTSSLEVPSIKWLLETSTDPEVFLAAASFVPHVNWPLDLDISDTLRQLYDDYNACLDIQRRIVPLLEKKASTCTKALCHLCCGRIIQGRLAFAFLGEGSTDYGVFREMLERTEVDDNVLVATTKLVTAKNASRFRRSSPKFGACPKPVLEWLSYALPFHFVIEQVDEDVKTLAMTVISTLLRPSSSPSPQIIANCTLLACVMVGARLDKEDIVRVDKRCY